MDVISALLALHNGKADIERGISLEAVVQQMGLAAPIIASELTRLQRQGLMTSDPDMNASNGVAQRFRATEAFMQRHPEFAPKW